MVLFFFLTYKHFFFLFVRFLLSFVAFCISVSLKTFRVWKTLIMTVFSSAHNLYLIKYIAICCFAKNFTMINLNVNNFSFFFYFLMNFFFFLIFFNPPKNTLHDYTISVKNINKTFTLKFSCATVCKRTFENKTFF